MSYDNFYQPYRTQFHVVVPEQTTTEPPPNDLEWIYEGCGESKVCYGVPANCVTSRTCDLFGAVTHDNGNFDFELLSMRKHF
jgi:hypothetical protein